MGPGDQGRGRPPNGGKGGAPLRAPPPPKKNRPLNGPASRGALGAGGLLPSPFAPLGGASGNPPWGRPPPPNPLPAGAPPTSAGGFRPPPEKRSLLHKCTNPKFKSPIRFLKRGSQITHNAKSPSKSPKSPITYSTIKQCQSPYISQNQTMQNPP